MDIGGTFVVTIIKLIILMLNIYMYLIIFRAIIFWVNPDPYNPLVQFLRMATDPPLRFLRRFIPPIGGALDLTPIIVIFVLYFIIELLSQYAYQLSRGF